MKYLYKAITSDGQKKEGTVEAVNIDIAISQLQKQGLLLSSVVPEGEKKDFLNIEISFFNKVSTKDIVILSRQLATLFDAQVSALRIFQLIGEQVENPTLGKHLLEVAEDLKSGNRRCRAPQPCFPPSALFVRLILPRILPLQRQGDKLF